MTFYTAAAVESRLPMWPAYVLAGLAVICLIGALVSYLLLRDRDDTRDPETGGTK